MSMVAQATPWHEKGHPEGCPSFPGGEARIRTGGEGFAGPCLTTWPLRHMKEAGVTGLGAHMERATGFEPATSTLARWRATNCAKPASARDNIREASASRKPKFQIRWKKLWGAGPHAERSAGDLREIAAWGLYLFASQYSRSTPSPHSTLLQCPCLAQSPPLPVPQCSGTLRGGERWATGDFPTLRWAPMWAPGDFPTLRRGGMWTPAERETLRWR